MKPRLLTILSTFALLLSAALAFLWLRSHHTHHVLLHPALGRVWQLSSLHGTLCFILHEETHVAALSRHDQYEIAPDGLDRERQFAFDRFTGTRTTRYYAEDQYAALDARLKAGEPRANVIPRLDAARHDLAVAIVDESRYFARSQATDAVVNARDRLGFHYRPADGNAGTTLTLPYWLLLALTASVPCIHLLLHRRARRRRARGHCPACNYDLRATPDRCPECGAAPAAIGYNPDREGKQPETP